MTGDELLFEACKDGRVDEVEKLFTQQLDVNTVDKDLRTPISWASEKGYKEIVGMLIAKGADVNAIDNGGLTPLHDSSGGGFKEIVELLITSGAHVSATDKRGHTALHFAAFKSSGHKEIIELLIAKGASVNAKDNDGRTPLHLALLQNRRDIAECLIAKGADVNVADRFGWPSLMWAVQSGNKETVKMLIANGAGVNIVSIRGATPLSIAKEKGHKDIVELLISKGAYGEVAYNVDGSGGKDSRKNLLDIGERLMKKAFDVPLSCPECGGSIENFSCRACVLKNESSRRGLFTARAGYAIDSIMSWITPFFVAGVGYFITWNRYGLIIGFFVGVGLAASGRKIERANLNRAKSITAPDLFLAEQYQQRPESYDMAAVCYLHWLAKWDNFDGATNLPMFLWRYRCSNRANAELRQLLLDRLFYKACPGSLNTPATANLIIAVANDSPEQIATAVALREWNTAAQISNRGLLRLSTLLTLNAPLIASAFAGTRVEAPNTGSIGTTVWHFAGEASMGWPKVDLGSIVAAAKEETLRFVYVNMSYSGYSSVIGITDRNVIVWTDDTRATPSLKHQSSKPLARVEKVYVQLSPDGHTRRALWLLSSGNTYCFDGPSEFALTLNAICALPEKMRLIQVRSPRDSRLLFWGRLGSTVAAFVAITGVAMIIYGRALINEKGGSANVGLIMLALSVFFGALPLSFVFKGLRGTRKAFMAEYGINPTETWGIKQGDE